MVRPTGLVLAFAILAVCQQVVSAPPIQRIVYMKVGPLENAGLFVSTIDRKEQHRIADIGRFPRWSPDGGRIVYSGSTSFTGLDFNPTVDLFVYDLKTRTNLALTHSKKHERAGLASWSPDGTRIAYAVESKGGTELFMMEVNSRQVEAIRPSGGIDCASDPSWAPDGNSLAVHDCGTGRGGLALIEPSGKFIRALTRPDTGAYDRLPVWSPDGKHIAFVTSRGDKANRDPKEPRRTSIFLVNTDGAALHPFLTHSDLSISYPSWSSDGKLFAYEASKPIRGATAQFTPMATKAVVMSVADGKIQATLGDDTGQPALAPIPRQ